MLTPAQVKNHRFELSGRGHYRADEVDDFFDEVYDSYSQMFKENGDLVRKIGLLADKVEEYRADEDNIRAALLTAQRMADKSVKEAQESVDGKVAEANKTAQNLVDEAHEKANAILEEAKFSAREHAEKAEQQAQALLSDAQKKAQEQAEQITGGAQTRLEEINRELALRSVELKKLNETVASFKKEITGVCGNFAELLEKLSVRADEELETRVEDYVKAQAPAASEAKPAENDADFTPPVPSAEEEPPAQISDSPEKQQDDRVQVEIDPDVLQSFSVARPASPESDASAEARSVFSAESENSEQDAAYSDISSQKDRSVGSQLKFGNQYDIFEDDEDEEEEDDQPNRPFLNFFSKK